MSGREKRIIIVTGASRGLGREIALKFGSAGHRIVIVYLKRDREAGDVAEAVQRSGGEAITHRMDVRRPSDVDGLISVVQKRWERLDVLVNNAGLAKDGLCIRMQEQDWDEVLTTNLKGPFLFMRAAAKIMIQQRTGHIVNIASITGVRGREGQANYSASKAGLIGLTKTAAVELGRFNVKVNAVLPGYLPTDMGEAVSDAIKERILRENALGKLSDPREVADFIYHLVSMNNVSGQVFNLDSRIV